jgi:small-conductance mechanosensitive channel
MAPKLFFLVLAALQTLFTFAASTKALETQAKFLEPSVTFASKTTDDSTVNENEGHQEAKLSDDEQKAEQRGRKSGAIKAQVHEQKDLVSMWFTWPFWRLLVACAITLLAFTEVIFPLAMHLLGRSLLVATITFFVQNFAFLCTAIAYATADAAGAKLCLVLSVVMCAISLLILLGAIGVRFQKSTPSMEILQSDLTYVFKPISIVVIIFLVVQGLLDSSGSDWGKLTLLVGALTLGISIAVGGLVSDVMSYCFIRANDYFQEGEFIMNDGELLQVKHIYWCYTFAYRPSTRSDVYVPNSALAGQAINNRSRDNARTVEIELDMPIAQAKKTCQDVMALIKKSDESGFTAINGKKFDGQIDANKSHVFVAGVDPGGDSCTMKIKLFAKYYYSKPPQWKMEDVPEPQPVKRQLEWQAGWNYQMEWLLLEATKVIDKSGK